MNEASETQKMLTAFTALLKKESWADIHTLILSALRALDALPSYEHSKVALAILTIPDDPEDETDA